VPLNKLLSNTAVRQHNNQHIQLSLLRKYDIGLPHFK
jgi:hypothetical protein